MKKFTIIIILSCSINVFAQSNGVIDIYAIDPTTMWESYSLPGAYTIFINEYEKKYHEGIALKKEYAIYEYPYFFYPFNFKNNAGQESRVYNKNEFSYTFSKRYKSWCKITMYQPEFNMLKRYFIPNKFSYTSVATHTLSPDQQGEGLLYPFIYQQIYIDNTGNTFPGEKQGFTKPVDNKEFNYFIASNEDFRFLIAIPKYIKIESFKKLDDAMILFLGTIYDTLVYEDVKEDAQGGMRLHHKIIDYVVLYDSRHCKFPIH